MAGGYGGKVIAYDTAIAKEALQEELAGIKRCSLLAV